MDKELLYKLLVSWGTKANPHEIGNILNWVAEKNNEVEVSVIKNNLSDSDFWFFEEADGIIRNKNNSFFQVQGIQQYCEGQMILEQPILVQNEIGYLGIICKEINGVLHFLMQAKIEPGNVNKIQISPTIQATKSNFTQKHGGKQPAYLEYFLNVKPEHILVDQIQSEQSSRFLRKRNRNIIIIKEEDITILPSHRWMTLGTIKQLMQIDNLVNMDTRTVLSCIPYSQFGLNAKEKEQISKLFSDQALFYSIFGNSEYQDFVMAFHCMNNYKMFKNCETKKVSLNEMLSWNFTNNGIVHKTGYPFKVIFCDIKIEDREVAHWSQPLFEAEHMAIFGLITAEIDGKLKFLIQTRAEVGCFDRIELAPTVQLEGSVSKEEYSEMDRMFFELLEKGAEVRNDVILSEEGGRFYHEQNRNVVLRVKPEELIDLPGGYLWMDYATLNTMVQFNNVLNIQLRNLLSLLEI